MRLSVCIISFRNSHHSVKTRIHCGIHVRNVRLGITLIVNKTGPVQGANRFSHLHKILSCRRLVSKWPHDDRGVISMLLHHSYCAVTKSRFPAWEIVQPLITLNPFKAVCFQIRFVNDIKSVLIAKRVKPARLRVMRTTDGIDIAALHSKEILLHLFFFYREPAGWRKIMHVHAIE